MAQSQRDHQGALTLRNLERTQYFLIRRNATRALDPAPPTGFIVCLDNTQRRRTHDEIEARGAASALKSI